MAHEATRSEAIAKLGELIQDIRIAMLTTTERSGELRSRPMATQDAGFDGTLWFFTGADSGKVQEISGDQDVNVAYVDHDKSRYVSVSGRATLVRDQAKIDELWSPIVKAWFPDGKDDPNLALLKVDVTGAEYWDAPSSKLVQVAGFVKAIATGQTYDSGEHGEVSL